MNVKVENLDEKNMAKITVTVDAADFDKAMDKSYNKNRNRFNVPGFRRGKATRHIVEKMYGAAVLFDDALNFTLDDTYSDALKESGLKVVSRPEIGVDQIEEGRDLVYTMTVAVRPEVTLGEYKGLTVEKAETTVTAKEVNARLQQELEKNARLVDVDREIKKDDIAAIDFVGRINGEEFPGGKAEDYSLTIGSGTFIPGFEDQLIGHKAGETVDVSLNFPEDYGAKDLAGKPVVFTVTIKGVKEKQVPEANDEFASEVSEFDTLADYKKDLKKAIKEEKEKQATTTNENNVVAKAVENASMDIPKAMIDTELDQMYYDYSNRLRQQGIPMDQYLQITGQTAASIKEQMRPQAEKNIRTSLVLEAIRDKEGIKASDERVEDELKKIADQYKMKYEDFEKTVTDSQKDSVRNELEIQDTIDLLVSEANLVKPEKKSGAGKDNAENAEKPADEND